MTTIGTAFFVGPRILLTAGHCVINAKEPTVRLLISTPGVDVIDVSMLLNGRMSGIDCTVVTNLFKKNGPFNKDIAIISSGSYISSQYIQIGDGLLPADATVDIVGYPGEVTASWLRKHQGLVSADQSRDPAERLLPWRHLVISEGMVVDTTGPLTSYKISTCRGMSGSCLVYRGKAYGIFPAPEVNDTDLYY